MAADAIFSCRLSTVLLLCILSIFRLPAAVLLDFLATACCTLYNFVGWCSRAIRYVVSEKAERIGRCILAPQGRGVDSALLMGIECVRWEHKDFIGLVMVFVIDKLWYLILSARVKGITEIRSGLETTCKLTSRVSQELFILSA